MENMTTTLSLEKFGFRVFVVGIIFGLISGFILGITFIYTFVLK